MVQFDPSDNRIPQKLRNRFIGWSTNPPRLQFSQYGPFNQYLCLKFPDMMVKPQGLIRPIVPEDDQLDGAEEDGGLCDLGDVSMDSTGGLS